MTQERNTTKVIANAVVDSDFRNQFYIGDMEVSDQMFMLFKKDASFRDMRRAAGRLGLAWEGTTNSNFRVKLTFSATNSPVYLPNGEVPDSIQEAFSKIFASVQDKAYSVVKVDTRCLRVSMWINRDSLWNAQWDISRIRIAMGMFQTLVRRAVIGKQGWKIINNML